MKSPGPLLTHDWIWRAVDALAAGHNLSPSALARLAGLDPTTFNRSKRFTPEGRPRWPSTESIAKVLEATGTSLDEFADIKLAPSAEAGPDHGPDGWGSVPVLGEVREAQVVGLERAGRSDLGRRGRAARPSPRFALAVADGSLEPVYRQGNTLIASVGEMPQPGDRVVVKAAGRQPLPRLLLKATAERIALGRFHPDEPTLELPRRSIIWIARIIATRP